MSENNDGISKSEKIILIVTALVIIACVSVIVSVKFLGVSAPTVRLNAAYREPDESGENYVVYDGIKNNSSPVLGQEKKYDKYIISGATLTYENTETTFVAFVNLAEEVDGLVKGKPILINLLSEEGEIVNKLKGYIPDINNNETVLIEAVITKDIVDAYDYEIVNDPDVDYSAVE